MSTESSLAESAPPVVTIGVVVASWGGGRGLRECLEALHPQRDAGVDVVVVNSGPVDPTIRTACDWCRWIEAPPEELIPELWKRGIEAARGEAIATTIAQFVPLPGWIAAARAALQDADVRAASGPIEPPTSSLPVAWATFLQRYHPFLGVSAATRAVDIPGDNAVYRRADLESCRELWRDGFWEPRVHARIRARGGSLGWTPGMRVRCEQSFGVTAFLSQRFRHGKRFGADRAAPWGPLRRTLGVVTSPLIPIVLAAKVLTASWRWGRRRPAVLASLPPLVLFVTAWAAGEACGYLARRPAISRAAQPRALGAG
jgi:hypothetical protein